MLTAASSDIRQAPINRMSARNPGANERDSAFGHRRRFLPTTAPTSNRAPWRESTAGRGGAATHPSIRSPDGRCDPGRCWVPQFACRSVQAPELAGPELSSRSPRGPRSVSGSRPRSRTRTGDRSRGPSRARDRTERSSPRRRRPGTPRSSASPRRQGPRPRHLDVRASDGQRADDGRPGEPKNHRRDTRRSTPSRGISRRSSPDVRAGDGCDGPSRASAASSESMRSLR